MKELKTQQEVKDTILKHKNDLKVFDKTFGFKMKTITLPKFMWDRILSELETSSVFCGRLDVDGYQTLPEDQVKWDTELLMAIESLQKKLNK